MNLPNRITFGRLLFALVFFFLLSFAPAPAAAGEADAPSPWLVDIAVAIFLIGVLTDFLDGYLARRKGLVTALGRIADPFVDKILTCGGFIYLTHFDPELVPPWAVVIIVAREFLITALRGFAESRGVAFGADWGGKIKMIVQSTAIPWILFYRWNLTASAPLEIVSQVLVWAAVATTLISMVHYIGKTVPVFREPVES